MGSAASSLNLDLNPCARALRDAAGSNLLQKECSTKGPISAGGIAVIDQTGALSCQTVILAVCSPWNNGQGKEVRKFPVQIAFEIIDWPSFSELYT